MNHTATELPEEEQTVLALFAAGSTEQAAARALGVSARTVRRRVAAACERLGVGSKIEVVAEAARRGLV